MDRTSAIIHPPERLLHVRAAELVSLLDRYSSTIRILSLDCFDTLLWRNTAAPSDVFYDLQHKPAFQSLQFTARLRKQSETLARQKMQVRTGLTEVKLKDIYQANFTSLEADQLHELTKDEMEAEIEACYPFMPMVELIRTAHSRGLKIIIVSDTYLDENQLQLLLRSKLPSDVMNAISRIFCSCEHGKSKSAGLFKRVLEKLTVSPKAILHIGDNQIADVNAALAQGIHAVKLMHHHSDITELMRMQALAASFIDPMIRNTRSLPSPFRGVLAADTHLQDKPENSLGYASVGPIMYAFGRFIYHEIELLKKAGKRPKVLFLMRDAYLPSLVCEALAGSPMGTRVRISRFAAYASSFRCAEDIDNYLASRIKTERFQEMCKQLLLPDEKAAAIIKHVEKANDAAAEFRKQIYKEPVQQLIFRESSAYRARLIKHLQKEVGLEAGDTLVFVDLGYTGTAQLKLEPVFMDEMKVEIVGRYLISLPALSLQSRKGLLDISHYDENALIMLVTYIALLEQICTSDEKSVVDYDEEGNAIYSEVGFNSEQHQKLKAIQDECLRFVRDAHKSIHQPGAALTDKMLRDAAAISLCRLLFLPVKNELDYLQSFRFDFNMGTDDIVSVFDLNKGLTSLRRRSWLHCAKESTKHMRTNYPAEWRAANLELALTLMSQHRYGLEFALNDLSLRREQLELVLMQNQSVSSLSLEAMPTHDGYFSMLIPVVNSSCQIGIRLGLLYRWVEVESAELIQLSSLHSQKEFEDTQDASQYMTVNEMIHKGGGLFECLSNESLLIFDPAQKIGNAKYILRIIFRPIVLSPVFQ